MKVSDLGEKGLIRRIAGRIRTDRMVVRGIGDDCAVLAGPKGKYLLFASDMLVEEVHFVGSDRPAAIGWKALAVNVSDVAAMGGVPRCAVVSLGLPKSTSVRFVDGLYDGLRRCADRFGVNLVGGDTDRSQKMVIDVAILGEVEKSRVVYRSGAKVGDDLFVTGRLGNSFRSGRHLKFIPRVKEARVLGERTRIHAMMDLSDGLGPDLTRLCEASGVAAVVEAAAIPRQAGASLSQALTDGEDFELLMAVAPSQTDRLLRWARQNLSCGLTRVGRVVPRHGKNLVIIKDERGRSILGHSRVPNLDGFRHF